MDIEVYFETREKYYQELPSMNEDMAIVDPNQRCTKALSEIRRFNTLINQQLTENVISKEDVALTHLRILSLHGLIEDPYMSIVIGLSQREQ